MRELAGWRAAIAFWTLLGAVVVTVLAAVAGNLAPTVLPHAARDAAGFLALALAFTAHALPLAGGLARSPRPVVPLQVASGEA